MTNNIAVHPAPPDSSNQNIARDVLLALRRDKIELWNPPYYSGGERDLGALEQLATDLADAPEDKDEVLLALYEYQARSVRKHGGNILLAYPTRAATSIVARTVQPQKQYNEPIAPSRMVKSAPNPNVFISPTPVGPDPTGRGVANTFLAEPSRPRRKPVDGCTKYILVTMIVFDSIAIVFYLTQLVLVGIGSALSLGAFLIAAILSCVLFGCTEQGGKSNKSFLVCAAHVLGLIFLFGGIAMLVASGFSADTDTSMEQILDNRLAVGAIVFISLTFVLMIVAVSCGGSVLCEMSRGESN